MGGKYKKVYQDGYWEISTLKTTKIIILIITRAKFIIKMISSLHSYINPVKKFEKLNQLFYLLSYKV